MPTVTNDIRVFPASNTGDWGRIFSEKNMKGILGFISSTKAVIEGFNISASSLVGTSSLTCNIMSGKSIFEGYQIDCFNEQYVVPFPDSFYPDGRTEPMVLPSNAVYYICLRMKFRIATDGNEDTTFIDYRNFGDMPDGYKTCPFVIIPAPSDDLGLPEDTIPDAINPSYDTGYVYKYLPLYKLIFRETTLNAEDVLDIRSRVFIDLDKIAIGYKGENIDDYFGFNANSLEEKTNDWRIKYILSNGGQIDSAERMLYQYIDFIHTVVRGYTSLESIQPEDAYKPSMFEQDSEELPIINKNSPEDSIVSRLKYYIETDKDFINNRIVLPVITRDEEGNITSITYNKKEANTPEDEYGYDMGHIVTLDNEFIVNRLFLPIASNENTGIVQIDEEFQADTETSYSNTNVLQINSSALLKSFSPRYSITHIKVKTTENSDTLEQLDILDNDSNLEIDSGLNISLDTDASERKTPIIKIAVYGTVSSAYAIQYDPNIDASTYPGNEGKTFYYMNQNLLQNSDVTFNSVKTKKIYNDDELLIESPEININGNVTLTAKNEDSPALNVVGTITATKVYEAVYNDYAEWFEKADVNEKIEEGDIIVKVAGSSGFGKSINSNDKLVVGVCSNTYGHILGGENLKDMEKNREKFIPVGLAGRVKVKVHGPIMEGDLIVTSTIPGVGMKCMNYIPGTIVGKCLSRKDNIGIDLVDMLIMLG